jgi:putrescine transport system ATP-binding protein
MLAGFEKPTSGRVLLGGQDVATSPYDRPINMMFQSYALFPHLDIWENIAFGLKREGPAQGGNQAARRRDARSGATGPFAKRKPHQLSGGQQQRVALARSLAKKPKLLLLDEPLGALDKKLREQTQFELVNIIEKVGVTCVMVTHDQEEAMTMANRIAIMSKGGCCRSGRPKRSTNTRANRFVADFIGNVNCSRASSAWMNPIAARGTTGIGEIHVGHGVSGTLNMPVAVAVRPEKIRSPRAATRTTTTTCFRQGQGDRLFRLLQHLHRVAADGSQVKITERIPRAMA